MNLLEFQVKHLNEAIGTRHLQDGYICPKCHNKGFLYGIRGDEIVSYRCSCLAIRKSLHIIKKSGLSEAVKVLSDIPDIGISYLTERDVVRHKLVQRIIEAYDRYGKENESQKYQFKKGAKQ